MLVSRTVCGKCFTCVKNEQEGSATCCCHLYTYSFQVHHSVLHIDKGIAKQLRIYNNEHQSTKSIIYIYICIYIYAVYTHTYAHCVSIYGYESIQASSICIIMYLCFSSHLSLCQTGKYTTCSLLPSSRSTQTISNHPLPRNWRVASFPKRATIRCASLTGKTSLDDSMGGLSHEDVWRMDAEAKFTITWKRGNMLWNDGPSCYSLS